MATICIGRRDRQDPIAPGSKTRLVGRQGTIDEIHQRLRPPNDRDGAVLQLTGGGGFGKSSLALEYCYVHEETYDTIFWLNAESPASVSQSYDSYRAAYQLDVHEGQTAEAVVNTHLLTQDNLLLVMDNIKDSAQYRELSPAHRTAATLVTTREELGWSNPLPVTLIDAETSRDWLLFASAQNSNRHDFGVDASELDAAEVAAAQELAEALGGLPLALRMATTYLKDFAIEIPEYLHVFRTSHKHVMDDADAIRLDAYEKTVYGTIAVAIGQLIEDSKPEAQHLLELISFYAPKDIPRRIFNPDVLEAPENAFAVSKAIAGLRSVSLIDYDPVRKMISVHPLTQEVTRYYLQFGLRETEVSKGRRAGAKVSILLCEADPIEEDLDHLATTVELADIEQAIQSSPYSDMFMTPPCLAVNRERLVQALRANDPAVVHFVGHSDEGSLMFHNTADPDYGFPIDGADLAEVLEKHNVQLVVLNSCYSAKLAESLGDVVPVVIGTTDAIGDNAARDFAVAFFNSLSNNNTFEEALNDGKSVLTLGAEENVHTAVSSQDLSQMRLIRYEP